MRSLKGLLATSAVTVITSGFIVPVLAVGQSQQDLDSTKADTKHHHVVLENDQVRVVRYLIPPGEKTEKHSHPNNVNVLLTDSNARVTTEDGKSTEIQGKAGAAA